MRKKLVVQFSLINIVKQVCFQNEILRFNQRFSYAGQRRKQENLNKAYYINIQQQYNINYFYCMSVKVQSEADKKQGSVSKPNGQSGLLNLNYPELHWDTIYIDTKFYIAHPLDLDKLLKLESEIKNQKIKLNLNQHSQHNANNNNRQDRTEISQIDNHRPVSALSRQCKTEINEVVQIKTKLKVQNQLIGQEQRYQQRAAEINKKKQELREGQQASKPTSVKSVFKQIIQSQGGEKQAEKSNILRQSSKGQKRIQVQKQKSIIAKEEKSMKIQKQTSQKSRSQIRKTEENGPTLEKNYISFHPDDAIKSPRFEVDRKSGKPNFEDAQRSRQQNFDGRQSLTNSSKAINKSFVVNLRKSVSNSKQLKQMKQSRPTSGRKIKSASSTHSKVYLQQLNKKIKDMQEHLQNIEKRQKQFQQIEKSRVVGRQSGFNNNKQQRKSIKLSQKLGEKKYSKESSQPDQLFPADYNLRMKKNNSRYQLETEEQRLKEMEKEKQKQSLRDQAIKSSMNSSNNKIQKFSNVSYENMNSNKSSVGEKEEKIIKQSHVFDLTIYRTKRLNFASSIVQYDHSEDLKKIRKDIAEQEQKQKMMEQIADLKKMIRELKLQKIKQESVIQQLEKKEKQKQSLKSLLNSKLDQGEPQQKLKIQSAKREKTDAEQPKQQKTMKKNEIVPSPKENRSRLQYKNEEKIEVISPIYTKKEVESKDEKMKVPPKDPSQKQRKRKRTEVEENQPTPKKTQTQQLVQRQSSQSKQFTRFPKEESASKRQIFKKQKIKPLNIETINSKGSQNLPSIHKNPPSHNSINPQQGSYRQFHPHSLKKKGIVVRQILDEQNGDYSHKSLTNQKNVEQKDNSYDNQSPLSTGRKIFQLQFVKEIKKKKQPEIIQEEPDLTAPQIKVSVFPLPKLPPTPSPDISQSDLLSLAKQICQKFNIKIESDEHIYMKKYKNCIIFKTPDIKKTVVWHYSGKFYVGGWDQNEQGQGKKHGQGFEFLPEKHYYKGQFLDGKKNGSGTMIFVNGNVYKGQWMKGLKHGLGVFYQEQTGLVYEGEWKEDKKYGKGVLKVSEQQFYDGTFVKSIKHGYGLELFNNGDYYKGQYKMGRFHGKGRYVWKNGASYDGNFVQGRREGIGRWKSSRNEYDIYFGEYKNDKKSGKGQYTWNNGTVYEGNFVNDLKHGEGRVEYPDGREIKGYWQNGKLVEVDQNIEQIQKESSKNQLLLRQQSQKFKELNSKQLQPSHRLTKI